MYTDPMTRVRGIAAAVAALWLVVHSATLILVPAFFIAGAEAAPLECTCLHDGNHHDCPMHHGSPMGARVCVQTTDTSGVAVLGSMLAQVGVIPIPLTALDLVTAPPALPRDTSSHDHTLAPPPPPPPRA
jgi:hypothetical protein